MEHRRTGCAGWPAGMWPRCFRVPTRSSSRRPNSNGPTTGRGTGAGTDLASRALYRHHEFGRIELGRVLGVWVGALDNHPDARRALPNAVLNGHRCVAARVGVHSGEGGARVTGTASGRRRTGFLDQADVVMGARLVGNPEGQLWDRS